MRPKTLTALTVLAALIALPAAAETTLEEILATHLESKGGIEAIDAIKSLRAEGSMSMGPGMEARMSMEILRPDSVRAEVQIQGMTVIQAYDGGTGWQVNPFAGSTKPIEVSGPELESLIDQADIDGPLINFEKRGDTLEYVGTEELDGVQVHKVKRTRKNGEETLFLLDAERCLEVKSRSTTSVQGTVIEFEATYGDYKEVAGVAMWHSLSASAEGVPMSQTITFEKIEANVAIAADRFKMPAVETQPAVGE